ncbi:polymorphic toxin-type HINT domain-containing protein [Micromonospora zamorensis]|uniref:polymorphic toxin-type HINT domain-containing protein n=1 Tax=Micromonospora zamorensis TaxID=709883 RepID=UPI0036CF9B7F
MAKYSPDGQLTELKYPGGLTRTDRLNANHTNDTADRLTDDGYVYDAFGRTTGLPGGLVNSYFANDLVQRQQVDDARQSWTLDPAHRFRAYTTETLTDGNWVNATSKLNHYGDDSDEPRWIVEDTTLGSITRNVSGPGGDLAATTSGTGDVVLQLTNLHGDVAVTVDPALTEPEFFDYDEFGVPLAGQAEQRYGWLGGKQRSGDAMGGVILMGVRLYSPVLGRFLQVDPVDGGNATAYDYCAGDPVNCTDLDGRLGWGSIKKGLSKVAKVASYASMIPGPIGTIAGVVSAVSYAATGNWREAAWAFAGAAAAVVGAGAAVKGARLAVNTARAAHKARKASKVRRAYKGRHRSKCNSFAPDTLVLTADGTYQPIASLAVGDLVTAVDPATNQEIPRPVIDVIVGHGTKHLVEIDLDGDDAETLVATSEHPIWVVGNGWTDAGAVRSGDTLLSSDGRNVRVEGVVDQGWITDVTVYNLNVADTHTFVVRSDGFDVLTHNTSTESCPVPVYKRPKRATTKAQRKHVNQRGAKCHTCGRTGVRMIADHVVPLVIQWYARAGRLNMKYVRSNAAVKSQCRPCSQAQSVVTRRYSLWKRQRLGI